MRNIHLISRHIRTISRNNNLLDKLRRTLHRNMNKRLIMFLIRTWTSFLNTLCKIIHLNINTLLNRHNMLLILLFRHYCCFNRISHHRHLKRPNLIRICRRTLSNNHLLRINRTHNSSMKLCKGMWLLNHHTLHHRQTFHRLNGDKDGRSRRVVPLLIRNKRLHNLLTNQKLIRNINRRNRVNNRNHAGFLKSTRQIIQIRTSLIKEFQITSTAHRRIPMTNRRNSMLNIIRFHSIGIFCFYGLFRFLISLSP